MVRTFSGRFLFSIEWRGKEGRLGNCEREVHDSATPNDVLIFGVVYRH